MLPIESKFTVDMRNPTDVQLCRNNWVDRRALRICEDFADLIRTTVNRCAFQQWWDNPGCEIEVEWRNRPGLARVDEYSEIIVATVDVWREDDLLGQYWFSIRPHFRDRVYSSDHDGKADMIVSLPARYLVGDEWRTTSRPRLNTLPSLAHASI